jgi:hypothetical protein
LFSSHVELKLKFLRIYAATVDGAEAIATQSPRSESRRIPIQTAAEMRPPIPSGQNGLLLR